ncbi:MAG: aminopeptidase [Clostridia bacterium]|nr:aminopeptidase [Clostridia bacterium]
MAKMTSNINLLLKKEKGYDKPNTTERKKITDFCEGYKEFIGRAKTERVFIKDTVKLLEDNGFKKFDRGYELKKGDKIYFENRGRALIAAIIGEKSLSEGVNLVGAHVDSPRLDLKPVPLFESEGQLYIKTHYYGGIKKYQWPIIPLSMFGTCILKNGKSVDIVIGEDKDDPVFVITDILPHLGNAQYKKPVSEMIHPEQLNAIGATIPYDDADAKEKVKLNFLKILNKKYSITEEDLISSEITLVPNLSPKDAALDRSLVAAYGQDDRVCAYTGLMALINSKKSNKTSMLLLSDKEEVGSMGNTGMKSNFFEFTLEELCEKEGVKLRDALTNTECLSADVCAAYDPNFPEVFEKNNSVFLNGGVALMKYSGSRGKSGTSDASAEFVGKIRSIFDKANVKWQIGELGKTDEGGGGTIAQFVANLGCEVIDCGVALLSMHSPYEVAAKYDIYMAYKAYKAFYEA